MTVLEILIKYSRELLSGISVTLELCMYVYPIGLVVGTLLGIASHRWKLLLGIPSKAISVILSSMPIIVFLFWLHYPLQYILDVVIEPFRTSVFALSLVMIFLIGDIVRTALTNFPRGLIESAEVCGLPTREAVRKIQMPLVFRQVLPEFLFVMVTVLQATLFTSLISVNEIFRIAQQINADIYKPVEIYTVLALFFIVICVSLNLLAYWLKVRYHWRLSDL